MAGVKTRKRAQFGSLGWKQEPGMREALELLAKREDMSKGAIVRRAVRQYLQEAGVLAKESA